MTNEEITTLLLLRQSEMIDGTMAGCLVLLFVTLDDERTATIEHGLTLPVEIGTGDRPASSDDHAVVALHAPTTVVVTDEEIVPALVLEDERSLDGIRPGIGRSGIGRKALGALGITSCDGERTCSGSGMQRRVEAKKLNTIPKRAVGQPRLTVVIDDKIRVDGIPVVATLA